MGVVEDVPRLAAAHDRLAENVDTISGKESRGFYLVEHCVRGSVTGSFASHVRAV